MIAEKTECEMGQHQKRHAKSSRHNYRDQHFRQRDDASEHIVEHYVALALRSYGCGESAARERASSKAFVTAAFNSTSLCCFIPGMAFFFRLRAITTAFSASLRVT